MLNKGVWTKWWKLGWVKAFAAKGNDSWQCFQSSLNWMRKIGNEKYTWIHGKKRKKKTELDFKDVLEKSFLWIVFSI